MRKLNYLFFLLAVPAMLTMTGCGNNDEDVVPEDCSTATFPETTGKSDVKILNFTVSNGTQTVIDAKAGDVLSLAIQVTKGATGFRPQKLRLYQSDCENLKGSLVTLQEQPGLEDKNTRLDLRNTDDAQIKTVLYTVPSGFNPLYLTIEVDESKDAFTYKRVKINVSNSGVVDSYSSLVLGSNASSSPSRLNAGSGTLFTSCDAVSNLDLVDITFLNSLNSPFKAYFASNPARTAQSGLFGSLSTTATNCEDDVASSSTAGGKATYFKKYTGTFDDDAVKALSSSDVATTDNQYVEVVQVGDVFAFLTSNGQRGLIKVDAASNLASTGGNITVSIKVQR